MCGIAGVYNLLAVDRLPAMVERLAHRGPDADGIYLQEAPVTAGLGHRRLSIIDLSSAADQPFVKDGLVLVFNGEIYNYVALRRELSGRGVGFRTGSDTEVLLEAWRAWGPDALGRLRGMFAFALLDQQTGCLVLARDPFGIKPLFFSPVGQGLVFASELKAVVTALDGALEVDPTAVVASLLYGWVPERQCVYRGVEKLPPGCWLEVTPDGGRRLSRYHDLARDGDGQVLSGPEAVERVRAVIEDSVDAHLTADVPVGTFLSGGLDSSLLTVLAARRVADTESYTIAFRAEDQRFEAMPDDLVHARNVAREHGLRLHEIEIAPDVAALLPRLVDALDEPIGDAAAINAYLICTAAREAGLKVLLSGMGADELFAGYRKHLACLLAARYRRLPTAVRARAVAPLVAGLPVAGRRRGYRTARFAKRFLAFADLPEEAAFRRSYTHYDLGELRRLVAPELAPAVDQLMAEHAETYWAGPVDDQVNRMCATDLQMLLPGLNLAYTDRMSMAASVEVRVPYVDKEVVATAMAVPGAEKVRGRQGKAVLKQAALAWLPRTIVYRPKALFSAPLRAWIRRDLKEMLDDTIPRGRLVASGLIDGRSVQQMIDEDRRGVADHSKELWHLLTLECWYAERSQAAGLRR